jgi:hypothetical protein
LALKPNETPDDTHGAVKQAVRDAIFNLDPARSSYRIVLFDTPGFTEIEKWMVSKSTTVETLTRQLQDTYEHGEHSSFLHVTTPDDTVLDLSQTATLPVARPSRKIHRLLEQLGCARDRLLAQSHRLHPTVGAGLQWQFATWRVAEQLEAATAGNLKEAQMSEHLPGRRAAQQHLARVLLDAAHRVRLPAPRLAVHE